MAKLVLLEPAQRELEEIAQLHRNLVGPNSARKVTNKIFDALSRLELFPLSGSLPRDKALLRDGYRYVVAGKYICVYRILVIPSTFITLRMVPAIIRSCSSVFCGMKKSKCKKGTCRQVDGKCLFVLVGFISSCPNALRIDYHRTGT